MRALGSQLSLPKIGTTQTPRSQTLELQAQKEENLVSQLEVGLGLELRGWSAGLTGKKPGFSTAHTGVVLCAWDPSTQEAEAGASGTHAQYHTACGCRAAWTFLLYQCQWKLCSDAGVCVIRGSPDCGGQEVLQPTFCKSQNWESWLPGRVQD